MITNPALTSDPMHREDRFIAACNSWSEFCERAKKLPSKSEKAAVFERLTQLISGSRRNIKPSCSRSGHLRCSKCAGVAKLVAKVDRVRREVEDEARRVK